MKREILMILAAAFLLTVPSIAQGPTQWNDALVDHMAGAWNVEGRVRGLDSHHTMHAEWVLNHQFLRIEEKTSPSAPKTESHYDALWFLGFDDVTGRYVLLLMDVYGARYSETLGYGTRTGNAIVFAFEYPDGSFHNTMRWDSGKDTWEWLLEQKDKDGKWAPFADLKLTRVATP